MKKENSRSEWFEVWFQEEYDAIYTNRNDQQAVDQVDAVLKNISLQDSARILDIGCGKGRHLKRLLQKGHRAVGIDLSFYLLQQAQSALDPKQNIARGDMRQLPFKDETFDMVCSFFTSFGYFKTKAENTILVEKFSSLVRPGGYLFIDLMNKKAVLKTLPKKDTNEIGGRIVTQDRYFKDNFVCKDITIQYDSDRVEKYQERVMVFERDELYDLFKRSNLEVVDIFGDEHGNAFTESSPRISFILKKGL